MFFYYDNEGRIKMRSDSEIVTDLSFAEIVPTVEEQEKIDLNYITFIKDGKLQFEISPIIEAAQLEQKKQDLKDKAKNGTLTMADVAQFLVDL